jgi:hypothetical protein
MERSEFGVGLLLLRLGIKVALALPPDFTTAWQSEPAAIVLSAGDSMAMGSASRPQTSDLA